MEHSHSLHNHTNHKLSTLLFQQDWWLYTVVSCCWSLFLYSVILHSWADSQCLHVILTWVTSFHSFILFYIHWSGVLTVLTWLVPHETAAASARSVYTIEPCTITMSLHAKPHNKMHACLAATCHVHFWQNVLNLLCATAVTWGWNGYCCACRDNYESGTLTTKLSLLPSSTCNKACLSKK